MDEKEKEEKEKIEESKKEKKVSWWATVPATIKVGGIALLLMQYIRVTKGGDINQFYAWAAGVFAIWFALGQSGKKRESGILSPEEAERIVRLEILRKKREGQIPRWWKEYVGPNSGLKDHEGLSNYYFIEVTFVEPGGRKHYKRAMVFAEGDRKGFMTLQDNLGRLTGRETIPTRSIVPRFLKDSKKHDLGFDKFLFGGK